MVPLSWRLWTREATLEAFWPMAQYTQMTPEVFWFIMAERAMEVLPVWRSPMISSRWPRPMGIMLSTARMPVSRGVSTWERSMMAGAGDSTGRKVWAARGWPSRGRPMGSMTRPSSSRPTHTSATRPVPRATLPGRTLPPLSSAALTPWRLMSRAMPYRSPANSSSSPYLARERPDTWTMPSAQLSTVPYS